MNQGSTNKNHGSTVYVSSGDTMHRVKECAQTVEAQCGSSFRSQNDFINRVIMQDEPPERIEE
jgi:hypothetical protein